MPTADELRASVLRYVELMNARDWKGIGALYADDATMEDPVGGEVHRGIDAVLAVYKLGTSLGVHLEITGPIRIAGNEIAFPAVATLAGKGGSKSEIDVIDVIAFDERGKFASLRAFWRPEDMRSA